MTWTTSARMARLARRTRFALLALVSLLLGHDAVYAAEHGLGGGFATAMTALGHDGYWGPFTLVATVAAIGLMVGSGLVLTRLQRLASRTPSSISMPSSPAAYRRELWSIWPRLFVAIAVLFAFQENIETFLARGDLPGIDVLLNGGLPVALPVLALVSLALAGVGALVRWRIATLQARIRAAMHDARPRSIDARPAREWAAVDAAAPHRWILDRRDAGRAPPQALPA